MINERSRLDQQRMPHMLTCLPAYRLDAQTGNIPDRSRDRWGQANSRPLPDDGAVHKYNVRRFDCGSSNTGSYEPAGDGRNIFNATQSMICILIHRNAAL
jgi:hypothetical protein